MKKRELRRQIEALRQEIERLEVRVALLEARPVYPIYVEPTPYRDPWKEYEITCTCGTTAEPPPRDLV